MFVSGYPTYPSSRGWIYWPLLFLSHYRPPTRDVFAPIQKITVSAADPRYFTCDANKIGYRTRADPRKLILNQTFTLIYVEKNPCTLPRRRRRNKPSVFFLLLNSSSSSGEPESVLEGQGEGGWIGGRRRGLYSQNYRNGRIFLWLFIVHIAYDVEPNFIGDLQFDIDDLSM